MAKIQFKRIARSLVFDICLIVYTYLQLFWNVWKHQRIEKSVLERKKMKAYSIWTSYYRKDREDNWVQTK